MRYVQLRAFHHVATSGGFSRAAELLRLTQPAVSDQVRRLEEEYDVLLFNRIRKQVSLTPEGEALLQITRRMFDNERAALDLLTERRAFRAGNLRIIADSAHHLVGVLTRFRQRHPMVRIHVQAGNSDSVTTALRRYEADVGVLGDVPDSAEFDLVPLGRSPIIAFAAKTHAAAALPVLRMADLPRWPLVLREDGSRTRSKLEQAAAMAGVALSPAIVAEGREAVREIVAAGGGIGFVSLAEFGEDRRLARIALAETPPMEMDETLICLPERRDTKLVAAFMDLARSMGTAPA